MVSKGKKRPEMKRFSITLEIDDYRKMKSIAENHKPRLSLQYVVQYAVKLFLESGKAEGTLTHL